MDKVVVIGGSGFLGSNTADELSRRGYRVTIFDQIESPWLLGSQEIVVGDVLDLDSVQSALEGTKYVYHFAGIADIDDSRARPFETINLNIMGVATALNAAQLAGVERFLYASTMYVYSPFGSFYRASKQSAETIIEAYHERYKLDYTLMRYGSRTF
jgi:UDP-glucose 4-epimerase